MATKASASNKKTPAKAPPAKAVATKTANKPASKALVKAAAAKPAPVVTVTTKHLAAALAEQHGLPKKRAEAILLDTFGSLVDHLKAGSRVRIAGLGIIEVKSRPPRLGRNPATGEAIQIKASKKVAFRIAKDLKDAI